MHVIVIGGGVIGLTCAYELARGGAQVTLVDARRTGLGASSVNAGWVCPADSTPVPAPGLIGQAMRWMLRRDSPFYIRPTIRPSSMAFMLGLWRRCNEADFRSGTASLLRLAEGTLERLDGYARDGMSFEMHARGLLLAFLSSERLAEQREHLELAASYGLEPRVLVGDAVREHEPTLSDAVRGGIFLPFERHLDPGAFTRDLARRCRELGVAIMEDAPIDRVERSGTRVAALYSGTRRFGADAFLLAAGAWSGQLSRAFGVGLPIHPGKGYSLDLPSRQLRCPVYLSEARVAVTPLAARLRLAGTMELGGLDERIDSIRVAAIARAPRAYFRAWSSDGEARVGVGMRPMSPDGLPIMGRLGRLENAYVSTGHAMLGLTLAPSSAAELTRLILQGESSPVLEPFRAHRFGHRWRGAAA